MGIRRITPDEIRPGAPDSSYLATGIRENLVELVRSGPQLHCGFTVQGPTYDLDGNVNFPAGPGLIETTIFYSSGELLDVGLTAFEVHLSIWSTVTAPDHGFRVRFVQWGGATYDFNVVNVPNTQTFITRICSGLPAGYYDAILRVFRVAPTAAQFFVRHFAVYPYTL